MIREIRIRNFKSIKKLDLGVGRVNVLIGENGCGKTNVLEAIAFAAAAASDKLDNEFLASRGIRTTEPRLMRSAFAGEANDEIEVVAFDDEHLEASFNIRSASAGNSVPRWEIIPNPALAQKVFIDGGFKPPSPQFVQENAAKIEEFVRWLNRPRSRESVQLKKQRRELGEERFRPILAAGFALWHQLNAQWMLLHPITHFLLFSPENTALRTFQAEGQILPLGIRGEGLFKQLTVLASSRDRKPWNDLRRNLKLLDWFDDLEVAPDRAPFDKNLRIRDRYLGKDQPWFDQRSSNEGFLFLLFYFTLLVSRDTPAFFAVDNIDQSLNPKTCTELLKRIVELSAKYGKQVILSTHSPAILDGLNLHDDEQRLFVLSRNRRGETRARRVPAPAPVAGEPPIKLSEAFLRGLLGGLPQNF